MQLDLEVVQHHSAHSLVEENWNGLTFLITKVSRVHSKEKDGVVAIRENLLFNVSLTNSTHLH